MSSTLKLFVGGMDYDATEDHLKDWFESNGYPVVEVVLPIDRMTNRKRGFGFVTVENTDDESADDVAGKFHNQEFRTRKVTVGKAHPKPHKEYRSR